MACVMPLAGVVVGMGAELATGTVGDGEGLFPSFGVVASIIIFGGDVLGIAVLGGDSTAEVGAERGAGCWLPDLALVLAGDEEVVIGAE